MDQIVLPVSEDFCLDKIIRHQPFFFFFSSLSSRVIRIGGELVTMSFSQSGSEIIVDLDATLDSDVLEGIKERVAYCLGTMDNLSDFYTICSDDKILSGFMDGIHGNRLLSAFTDFEALVSIICSQNVSFSQYKKMVLKIVEVYGGAFPSASDILDDTSLLSGCGVGYRAAYIENVAMFMKGKDIVDDAYRLSSVVGIGPYSIDIFMLFQKRQYDFFYVDSLIKKIIRNDYGVDISSDKDIRAFAQNHWGRYRGLCEVYLQKFLYDN